MTNIHSAQTDEHQDAWQLLPWLVNETLAIGERERVLAHVKTCVPCRDEIEQQRLILTTMQKVDPLSHGAPSGADALLERIDSAERRDAIGAPPKSARFREWKTLATQPVAIAASLAAVLIAVGLIALPPADNDDAAVYRTLTDVADLPVSDAPFLAVIFAGQLPESERLRILGEIGGQIISGPSTEGLYTIAIESDATDENLSVLLQQLRQDPRVRFAEHIYSRPDPDQ